MTFTTASGSVYQVDTEDKRIRQIKGRMSERVNRNGNGQWVDFTEIDVRAGRSAFIVWPRDVAAIDGREDATEITTTSRVVSIVPCLN